MLHPSGNSSDMSPSTLNFLHSLFQIIAIISTVLALVAGAGTFWTGSLKDRAAAEEAAKAGPRALTDRQRSTLKSHLVAHPGTAVTITAAMGDPEALSYARDFRDCFIESGWRVAEVDQALWAGEVPGLWITRCASITDLASAPVGVTAVLTALVDADVPMSDVVEPDHQLAYEAVALKVGPRSGKARVIRGQV